MEHRGVKVCRQRHNEKLRFLLLADSCDLKQAVASIDTYDYACFVVPVLRATLALLESEVKGRE